MCLCVCVVVMEIRQKGCMRTRLQCVKIPIGNIYMCTRSKSKSQRGCYSNTQTQTETTTVVTKCYHKVLVLRFRLHVEISQLICKYRDSWVTYWHFKKVCLKGDISVDHLTGIWLLWICRCASCQKQSRNVFLPTVKSHLGHYNNVNMETQETFA